jgi:hypothetical protein
VPRPVTSSATSAPSSPSHPTDTVMCAVSSALRTRRVSRGIAKLVVATAVKAAPQAA